MIVNVALVQFDAIPEDVEGNLGKMEGLAERAAALGSRWVFFHEGTVADYTPRLDELAEPVPEGSSTQRMMRLSRRLGCYISFGLSEKADDRYHITQAFVGPEEGFIHGYRKTWLWRSESDQGYRNEWARYDPGGGPELFDMDGVKATCFICADGEAPRCIDRAAALKPDVVFFPNNRGSLPSFRVFGERARKIGAPMLVTNRIGKSWLSDCKGGCMVYSSRGHVLAKANREGKKEILTHAVRLGHREVVEEGG